MQRLLSGERWIMDGNYGGTFDIRLAAADTVIYLDFSPVICLYRVIKRRIANRGKTRSDMGPGCPEKIDWEFIKWVWTFRRIRSKAYLQKLREGARDKNVFVLRRPGEVSRYLRLIAVGIGKRAQSQ